MATKFRPTDLSIFSDTEREHPAWTSFVITTTTMARAGGRAALVAAWDWFKAGWLAYQAAAIDTVHAEEELEAQQEEEILAVQRNHGKQEV